MKNILTLGKYQVLAGLSLAFVISFGAIAGPHQATAALPAGFATETIATGLSIPTGMAFTPDGRIFVAEKSGAVRIIKNGQLLATPLIQLTDVNTYSDRGLIGIAVDPNFAANGYVYLSYTYENTPGTNLTGAKTGRIVRITAVGDTASESSKVVLVGTVGGNVNTPSCENYAVTADCIPSDSSSHSTGGLRFGLDGKLYATLGDGSSFDVVDPRALRAQNLDSLGGKMLRINTDGTAPADNPYYNGNPNANRSKVYAYGFRNMYRFNFRSLTGTLYGGDVGWDTWEEINKIVKGGNYGWPCREGNNPAVGYNCTATNPLNPFYSYIHDPQIGGAVTAGAFGGAGVYPAEYANSMFFGDYAFNWIKILDVTPTDTFVGIRDFMSGEDGADGPVEFITGPDGHVYFISIYTGSVRRIIYTQGNRQPTAQIAANPVAGLLPLTVNFSSAGSSDPDNDPLTYLWTFGDGATSALANPSHTYTTNGTYTVSLKITDGRGGQDIKSITVYAGNRAPVPQITAPRNGDLYTVGETLTVTGTAQDPEEGTLTGTKLSWRAILHHNTHTHLLESHTGTTFQFTAPDHGDPEVYTELELTATDTNGASAKTSINLYLDNRVVVGGNLVQNGSFEQADSANAALPAKWLPNKWGTNTAVFTYPVSGYEGGSSKAARIQMSGYVDGDAKWMFDPAYVDENKAYEFSNYYMSTVPTRIVAQAGFANGTYFYDDIATLPAAATWTKAQGTFTTPPGTKTLTFFHIIDSNGTLTVDNYSLIDPTVTPPPPPPPATNLIANPSVETAAGTLPQGWATGGWGTNNRTFTYPATGFDGAKSVKVDITTYTNGDAKWFFTPVAVTPGSTYIFSDYYTATVPTKYFAQFGLAGGTFQYQELATVPAAATATKVERSIIIPAGVQTLTVFHALTSVGSLTTDNFSLTTPGTTTPENLVVNGFLETANGALPQGWTPTTVGSITPTFTYPVTGVDGGKAASIAITNAPPGGDVNARWQFTDVPISTGVEYTYEGYYKGSTISDIIGRYTFNDNSEHFFGLKKEIPAATDWTFITGKFVGPANVKSITLMHQISTNATLSIDNIKLFASGTGTPAEITPPVVNFTNPLNGQTVSGTVTLSANATDNVGVAGLFFAVDGTPLSAEMTSAPWTMQWDSRSVSNGTHTLKVTARDAAGNNSREIITVTVNNTTTPPPPTGTNLILNPSLETANGTLPANWSSNAWGTNTPTFTYPVAGQDGTKAAQVTITGYASGDAKWYFQDVTVTPGTTYTYSNYYKSTIPSRVVIRYKSTANVLSYVDLGTVSAAANWTQVTRSITVPANMAALTVFHIIEGNGTLTVDNYSLSSGTVTPPPPPPPASTNLILNPSLETANGTLPLNWHTDFWGTNTRSFTYPVTGQDGAKAARVAITAYTSGDAKWAFDHVTLTPGKTYLFSDYYQANVVTRVVVEYIMQDNTRQYQEIATAPVSASAWRKYEATITPPANAKSMTVFHLLSAVGNLTLDTASLTVQ